LSSNYLRFDLLPKHLNFGLRILAAMLSGVRPFSRLLLHQLKKTWYTRGIEATSHQNLLDGNVWTSNNQVMQSDETLLKASCCWVFS